MKMTDMQRAVYMDGYMSQLLLQKQANGLPLPAMQPALPLPPMAGPGAPAPAPAPMAVDPNKVWGDMASLAKSLTKAQAPAVDPSAALPPEMDPNAVPPEMAQQKLASARKLRLRLALSSI